MPDTRRTISALQALLADNTAGDISAQDVRDFLVSVYGGAVLEEQVASASASLDFPTVFSSLYNTYQIVLDTIVPATNSAIPYLRFSTNGSTFDSTAGNYVWGHVNVQMGGVSGANVGSLTTETALKLFTDSASSAGISSSFPIDMTLTVSNPLGSAFRKNIYGQGNTVYATGPASYMFTFGGIYTPTTALTGFQFRFHTGNISSGAVRVYGMGKV